jgi:hypothetical protein
MRREVRQRAGRARFGAQHRVPAHFALWRLSTTAAGHLDSDAIGQLAKLALLASVGTA